MFWWFWFCLPSGPNRSNLQDMLANLRDAEDPSPLQPPVAAPPRPRGTDHELGRHDDGNRTPDRWCLCF